MEWTFDRGLTEFATLGAEYAPGVVFVVHEGKRVDVVRAEVGIGCILTEQGMTLLSHIENTRVETPKPAKRTKKADPVVESANALVDDLDLGD